MKKILRVLFSLVLVVVMSLSFTTNAMAEADGHPDVSITKTYDYRNKNKILTLRIRNDSKKKIVVSKFITSYNAFGDTEVLEKFDNGKNVTIAPGESAYETVTVDGKYAFGLGRFYIAFKYNNKYFSYLLDPDYNHYKNSYSADHVYGHDVFEFADGSTYDYWELETKKFFKTGLHDLTTD